MQGLRLIPDNTNIPFTKWRYAALVLSVFMLVGSVFMVTTKGLNFGIDFSGGILIEVQVLDDTITIGDMRSKLGGLGLGDVSLQQFGEQNEYLIRIQEQEGGEKAQQKAINDIQDTLGKDKVEYRRTEVVGPQVGAELIRSGVLAVVFSMLGIAAYIGFRFEWQFAVGAIVALLHDTIIPVGLFSLLQMDFNLTTVAAILTIAGYSTNDTVVVFDRVREFMRKYKKMPLPELFDMAINTTLSRTILTGGTTLIALIALWAFGGEVIRGFVIALIWGVIIGTYSSVFVATPLLLYLGLERDGAKKK